MSGIKDMPEEPWYVAQKRLDSNELIVVQGGSHPLLFTDTLFTSNVHWINQPEHIDGFKCHAKSRYRQADQGCLLTVNEDGKLRVEFDERQRAITPGQSVVFYSDDECLGGGVIETTFNR